MLVLERLAQLGRLQFLKANGLLPRTAPAAPAKSKLETNESTHIPPDHIHELFVGRNQSDPEQLGRYIEGVEDDTPPQWDTMHIGKMTPAKREEMRTRYP